MMGKSLLDNIKDFTELDSNEPTELQFNEELSLTVYRYTKPEKQEN